MPQTFVQAIVVQLSNTVQFTIYIANTVGSSQYAVELLLSEPGNALLRVAVKSPHTAASMAFNEAITSIESYLKKHSQQVASINSPCNAPFIDKAEQSKVLKRHGIQTNPTVNGQ